MATSNVPPPAEPSVPGYGQLTPIGRGGLGDVYKAVRVADGLTVAVKVLRDIGDGLQGRHRVRRELTALVSLHPHPNVVQPIELIELESGPAALVMEFAAGGSVAALLTDEATTLTLDEALFVGRQTASAMAAAHARGIVHRDIKPQNLLIDATGQIKLCDFGIAALLTDDEYRTRTNAMSMRYASPEDLEPDADVGPASDVYSLGATLLYLSRRVSLSLKDRLVAWEPPPGSDARRQAFDRLLAGCLQPDPALRPDASQLVEALGRLSLGGGSRLVTRLSPPPRPGEAPIDAGVTSVVGELRRDAVIATAKPVDSAADDTTIEPAPIDRPGPRIVSLEHLRRRTRPRWRLAIAGSAVMIALAIGTALVVGPMASDGSHPSSSAPPGVTAAAPPTSIDRSPHTVARPAGLPPLTAADWSATAVGDCAVQRPARQRLEVVSCDDPHDVQHYASGRLPGNGVFDGDAVAATVTRACDDALAGFAGTTPDTTELDIAVTRPSSMSWAAGDRDFACYVGIAGQRIVGDARTSGW
jgi:hypothetical protein